MKIDLPLRSDTNYFGNTNNQYDQEKPFNLFGNSYFSKVLFIPKSDIPYMPIIVH